MKQQKFEIKVAESSIDWVGRKVTGAHNGTIALKHGELTVTDGRLSAGRFVIDTTSIKVTDISDPATNAQFAGHLFSDDFFSTERYPEAGFVISSVHNNRVTGDLTIKGITHPVSFDADVQLSGGQLTAFGKIVIDRTKYDIRYRSGNFFKDLGDTLIYNDFELNVSLTAQAA